MWIFPLRESSRGCSLGNEPIAKPAFLESSLAAICDVSFESWRSTQLVISVSRKKSVTGMVPRKSVDSSSSSRHRRHHRSSHGSTSEGHRPSFRRSAPAFSSTLTYIRPQPSESYLSSAVRGLLSLSLRDLSYFPSFLRAVSMGSSGSTRTTSF